MNSPEGWLMCCVLLLLIRSRQTHNNQNSSPVSRSLAGIILLKCGSLRVGHDNPVSGCGPWRGKSSECLSNPTLDFLSFGNRLWWARLTKGCSGLQMTRESSLVHWASSHSLNCRNAVANQWHFAGQHSRSKTFACRSPPPWPTSWSNTFLFWQIRPVLCLTKPILCPLAPQSSLARKIMFSGCTRATHIWCPQ